VIGHFGGIDIHDKKNPKDKPSKNIRFQSFREIDY
jgi:hypothetical protein